MYCRYSWYLGSSIEHEYKYAGNYGARGEKRQKRKKPTSEEIEKQNKRNRIKKIRRLIKANFREGDYWMTLKYPKGTRKEMEEIKKDIQKFFRRLRTAYRKEEKELKFIYRVEIGRRGGIHFHLIANRVKEGDRLIRNAWTFGSVNYAVLSDAGGYEGLAEYICKEVPKEIEGQLSLFDIDKKEVLKISTSRNLIRPQPERKKYFHWTMRKILQDGAKPTPGYYIDPSTVKSGVNMFTGYSYYSYIEYRIGGNHGKDLHHHNKDGTTDEIRSIWLPDGS